MILIDEDHPDTKVPSPTSASSPSSSERTPLLVPSRSVGADRDSERRELERSSSPPPLYTPPALVHPAKARRGRRWKWVVLVVIVVVVVVVVCGLSTMSEEGGEGEVEGGGPPIIPPPVPSPPVKTKPVKDKVDKGSKGRG